MGFYLQALREEDSFLDTTDFDSSNIATPDDKYEVELKKVEEIIDDVNDNYADQSSQEELDGQDLEENPVEECMIAMAESEHNWNMIMQAIGTREIAEAARGREMVMEAVDVKGFLNKIKEFFVKMYKKLTAIVKNWISNASAVLRTNKSFISKYKSKLAAGKAAYEKAGGKAFKGWKFNQAAMATKLVEQMVKMDIDATDKACSELKKYTSMDKFSASDKADLVAIANEHPFKEVLDADMSELSKKFKEDVYGSSEKVTLTVDLNSMVIAPLERDQKDIANVKKAYKSLGNNYGKIIKALNDIEKVINKSDADESKSSYMRAITEISNVAKKAKNYTHIQLTTLMKAYRTEKAQARKIANAYIFALNKGTRKDASEKADAAYKRAVGESGFLSNIELI